MRNMLTPVCLAILRLDISDIPRFRDAWFSDDGRTITVLTRTGGNNRPAYVEQNAALVSRSGYVTDVDDGDDHTYARFIFTVPDIMRAPVAVITNILKSAGRGEHTNGPGAWMRRLDSRRLLGRALTETERDSIMQCVDDIERVQ